MDTRVSKGKSFKRAQAMIIVTILMGGLFMAGTAVAGLLMFYELRRASDAESSGAAVFAADAGMESSLYCYFTSVTPPSNCTAPILHPLDFTMCSESVELGNGASASSSLDFTCENKNPVSFEAVSAGYAGKAERILESYFSLR